MVQRVVHDLVTRYGIEFRWKGNWRFFGLIVMDKQRLMDELDPDDRTV